MVKKVFVTGADGMLGTHICLELLKQGYHVKAICLPNTKSGTLKGLDIEIKFGDIRDKSFILSEMQGCNSVIHIAAITTVWPRRLKIINEVNFQGTSNIADAVQELNLERMVHIGTANSFGHGSKSRPGNEHSPFNSAKYGMDYIDSKLMAQKMLLGRHAANGFPILIINPTFMIGPYDSGPSSGKMLIGTVKGDIPAYAKGGKNFVYTADVAKSAVNALTMGKTGECYIAGHENLSYKEFFKKISVVSNRPFKMRAAPGFLILMLGAFNSLVARINGKTPKISFTMARMSGVGQFTSSEKAQKELKMPQTPIEEAIKVSLKWFDANGYLK